MTSLLENNHAGLESSAAPQLLTGSGGWVSAHYNPVFVYHQVLRLSFWGTSIQCVLFVQLKV